MMGAGYLICSPCLVSTAKWLNEGIDPIQIAAVRYIGSFLLVGVFFNPWTRARILRARRLGLQWVRALPYDAWSEHLFGVRASDRFAELAPVALPD